MENELYMVHIAAESWLPGTYARALKLADLLRFPRDDYAALPPPEQDRLRQSQIELNEVVRILGYHERHALLMKSDKVLGWVLHSELAIDPELKAFEPIISLKLSSAEFFESWKDTSYVWGGITHSGIDCSGLTQRYFRDVLDQVIPKNTFDQRRSGTSKALADISEHDLIFCTRIGGRGTHHVGIYVAGDVWHAHRERGVIRQSLTEFLRDYQVLEVVSLSSEMQQN